MIFRAAYAEEGGPRSATPALLAPGRPGPLRRATYHAKHRLARRCSQRPADGRGATRPAATPARAEAGIELAAAEQAAGAAAEDRRHEVAVERLRAGDELHAGEAVTAGV